MTGGERRATRGRLAQERVEHVARAVGVRKQLAARFLVQPHAEIAKETDRVVDRKGAQHIADDRSRAAPEILIRDDGVGDVAARTAADQNFCAGPPGALEQDDRERAIESAGENGGREAGRAGADDRHVTGWRKVAHAEAGAWPAAALSRYARCHWLASRLKSVASPRTRESSAGSAVVEAMVTSATGFSAVRSENSCIPSMVRVGSDATLGRTCGAAAATAGAALNRSLVQRSTRRRACGSRMRVSALAIVRMAASSMVSSSSTGETCGTDMGPSCTTQPPPPETAPR